MARSDSAIGYVVGSISVPTSSPRSDSPIGFVTGTITGPSITTKRGDSPIGFVTGTITVPHAPFVMFTNSGTRRTKVVTYDGTRWR